MSMNAYKKARDLGWEIHQVTARAPYEYHVRRIGWMRKDGPPADTHYVRGRKELEALLTALENGESTDRWKNRGRA